jgi:hypothetical protein
MFHSGPDTFDLDALVVPTSEALKRIIGGKPDWAQTALPAFRAVKEGKVKAFRGRTSLTFYLNVRPERLPPALPYLHAMRCAGMAPVEPDLPGFSRVTIPVMDGGLAELVAPRAPLLHLQGPDGPISFVPCVQANFNALYVPDITDGRFRGRSDVLCSMPSGVPGISHAHMRAQQGKPGVLYLFVIGEGGQWLGS